MAMYCSASRPISQVPRPSVRSRAFRGLHLLAVAGAGVAGAWSVVTGDTGRGSAGHDGVSAVDTVAVALPNADHLSAPRSASTGTAPDARR